MVLWTAPLVFTVQLVQRQNLGSRMLTEIHEYRFQNLKTKMDDDPLILRLKALGLVSKQRGPVLPEQSRIK